ncbi:hypothetical protein BKA60DRAFT_602472 [Fusarium oxysporum]|nr:hypothetical protein BKA60DRAFT_602472 [Fusarium oxysporum]
MKSYILATIFLGSISIASAAEYPSMIMDTWCITIDDLADTNDQSIIASETVTTPTLDSDLSTLSVARTDSEAPSSGPMTGSLAEPIVTPSLSATDITSSTLPTSTGVVEPPGRSVIFLVQAPSNQKRDIKKREIGGFVGADNPDVCTFALTFNLAEGQLFVNGLPTSYAGEDYKALGVQDEDSFIQGSITKTFGTTGRTLFFRNSGLPNGEAGFCQDSSGQVYIIFSASPPGCVPVTLGVYDGKNNVGAFTMSHAYRDTVTQCQNGQLVGFETSTSALPVTSEETTLEPTTSEATTPEITTPEVTTPEVTTPEAVSSGGVSSGKPTTAETTVSTEFNSLSSDEPSSTFSEPSGSEAFTTVSSQIVPTASSQIINTSTLTSSQIFGSVSSTVSSEPGTGVFSTVSSQTISSSASAISSEAPITVSSQITFGVVTSTIASSELVESSTSSESASPSTLSSTEETTINESTTSSESTTEITSTTTEASTADTTTDLTSTTTTAAPPSECENTSNPYTVSGVDFTISCNSVVTGGTSVGTAPSSSFNQCVSFCVAFPSCVAIQYERATGSCTGFSAMGGTAANSAFDVAARV